MAERIPTTRNPRTTKYFLGAALAVLAMSCSTAKAQTSSGATAASGTFTPAPASTSSGGVQGTVECWQITTIDGEPASFPIAPGQVSTVSNVACWEVLSSGSSAVPSSLLSAASVANSSPSSGFQTETTSTSTAAGPAAPTSASSARTIKLPASWHGMLGAIVTLVVLALSSM